MTLPPDIQGALARRLHGEVGAGITLAADSVNAGLPHLAVRVTTMYSLWYARTCRVCLYKFREGDRVRLCPSCQVAYHDDEQYALFCWQRRFAGGAVCTPPGRGRFSTPGRGPLRCDFTWTPGPSERRQREDRRPVSAGPSPLQTGFLAGLETVWRPYGERKCIEVTHDSPEVGRCCPWCRFGIRPGDRVVACPCRRCGAYFHQDVLHRLTCWNEWHGVRGNGFCPILGAPYEEVQG
jgi:hypothetical protein